MSIFSSIMNKIFHHEAAAATPSTANTPTSGAAPTLQSSPASTASSPSASVPAAQQTPLDVEAVLSGMASKSTQNLDYKKSIVDLMKLLDLDSSLTARKELAKELHFTGDTNDSASMNVWLHKQVMQKLAENGGKVPESLRA